MIENRVIQLSSDMKHGMLAIRIVIAVLVVLFFVMPEGVPAQIVAANARKIAPPFSLPDATSAPIRLSDYKGSVVLLNFWATWCHGCKTEIPWYVEFQNKYGKRGLVIIGASMDDEGWKVVAPFVKAKKLNYPVVIANDGLAKQYRLGAMPLSVLIDRDGRVADSHSGVVDRRTWEAAIQKLLDEK